jgi:hypothetical protein
MLLRIQFIGLGKHLLSIMNGEDQPVHHLARSGDIQALKALLDRHPQLGRVLKLQPQDDRGYSQHG